MMDETGFVPGGVAGCHRLSVVFHLWYHAGPYYGVGVLYWSSPTIDVERDAEKYVHAK